MFVNGYHYHNFHLSSQKGPIKSKLNSYRFDCNCRGTFDIDPPKEKNDVETALLKIDLTQTNIKFISMKLSLPLFINVILLLNLSQAAKYVLININKSNIDWVRPIARHMVVHVPPGAEAVVELKGYDTDGDPVRHTFL